MAGFEFRRLERFRWEAYEVLDGGTPIGFVSCLPEGLWLAYRDDGLRRSGFPTQEAGAAFLQHLAQQLADEGADLQSAPVPQGPPSLTVRPHREQQA